MMARVVEDLTRIANHELEQFWLNFQMQLTENRNEKLKTNCNHNYRQSLVSLVGL